MTGPSYSKWASSTGYMALCAIVRGHRVGHDWLQRHSRYSWKRWQQDGWRRRWHVWSDFLARLWSVYSPVKCYPGSIPYCTMSCCCEAEYGSDGVGWKEVQHSTWSCGRSRHLLDLHDITTYSVHSLSILGKGLAHLSNGIVREGCPS